LNGWIHGSSLFPRRVDFVDCGPRKREEPSGGNVLRLTQIRFPDGIEFRKNLACMSIKIAARANR
jgi:hypothetical protein